MKTVLLTLAEFTKGFFGGWMDDIRIYNRVLSDAEVAGVARGPG